MPMRTKLTVRPRHLAVALLAALALAGCAKADKNAAQPTTKTTAANQSMSGMSMSPGASSTAAAMSVPSVNGIKPVASQVLATADWQGMKIQARTMTPTSFVVDDGTSMTMEKATPKMSFHLMVMLSDAHTGVAIPYAAVWVRIFDATGKRVYSERQWPMLSAYMGPHYGNNVTLPGAGRYRMSIQVSPPVAARHLEYQHVWLKTHTVTASFAWKPPR